MTGPLAGLRIVELVGQGPGPFAAMLLAQLGAEVVGVERAGTPASSMFAARKQSVVLDLKSSDDRDLLLGLFDRADALIDPFRPGVCERLGIGPDVVMARNPRMIYGRMTGFGQEGPLALAAGHDINYIALSGALDMLGAASGPPQPPINLLGDFAGGGMLLALGILAAAYERSESGAGQVIDAAMIDGATLIALPMWMSRFRGSWGPRGTNYLDGASHFYGVYECSDGGYVSVGAIEPQFYAELIERLGLDPSTSPQHDRAEWPRLKAEIADVFRQKTRDEWCGLLEGTETCFAPVLSPRETATHPHHLARGRFPDAAPRFSRTPGTIDGAFVDVTEVVRSGRFWAAS